MREWDQLGRFMVSREIAAHESWRSDVIVGYQLGDYGVMSGDLFGGDPNRPFSTNLLFADNHVSLHRVNDRWGNDFAEAVEADRLARQELGLSEPPEYERVIREFMAKQRAE